MQFGVAWLGGDFGDNAGRPKEQDPQQQVAVPNSHRAARRFRPLTATFPRDPAHGYRFIPERHCR